MFNNLNLGDMLSEIQKKAQEFQEKNSDKQFTSKSGGGMVSVTMSGANEVIDIEIDDSLLEDKESMQILLISAINDTIKMVEEDRKHSALQMVGGMNPFGDMKS